MFLGLVVEPSKSYSQTVPATFKVTMASLGPESENAETLKAKRNTLILKLDGKEDFSLCSLTLGKVEQQALDLVFNEGEEISFHVDGDVAVHLSGYYIDLPEKDDFIDDDEEDEEDELYSDEAEEDSQIEYDSELEDEGKSRSKPRIRVLESDEEIDSDEACCDHDSEDMDSEDMDSEDMDSEDMDSEDMEDSAEESEEESDSEDDVKPTNGKRSVQFDLPEVKKVKEAEKKPAAPAPAASKPAPVATAVKVATKPVQPEAKTVQQPAQPAKQQQQVDQSKLSVKKTLPSGLQIEDLKLGGGAKVTNGKSVLIHYKGTLLNGSVFDSSFGGKPLKFVAGKGQVIKGMDIGIIGMGVGGSRKLVIPGPLAYGNQALPKIPRNSTLVFEIRLEKIL